MSYRHRHAATDQEIQKWVARHHGFVPESHWITHCKELCGLTPAEARQEAQLCPAGKLPALKQALRHFGLLHDEPPT